jgi:hypothetical protein
VLFGRDRGYGALADGAYEVLSILGLAVALWASVVSLGRVVRRRRLDTEAVLLAFGATNLAVVLLAMPHVPGIPRYSLFLFAPAAVLVARLLDRGWRRGLMVVLVAFGALGSLGQASHKLEQAADWRRFVGLLEETGVRHCYTDFYLSTPINFFSEERVVCSSRLGPTTTEYFFDYRTRVDQAPAPPAIVAVNQAAAARVERRLGRMGVRYLRRDGMKPVFFDLARRVDPQEIFPARSFSPR